MIELRRLEKIYENATPLRDVGAVINNGEIISVIDPSGTGKSTPIRVTVEHSAAEGQTMVEASRGGERFDPAEGANKLSYTALTEKGLSWFSPIRHSVDSERRTTG